MESKIREENILNPDRINFLDNYMISLCNNDNSIIAMDSKKIDYYDQSYVSKIFNSKEISKEIETYFQEEFDSIGELNKEQKLQEIKLEYNNYLNYSKKIKPNSNISDFVGKYILLNEKNNCLKFAKSKIKDAKKNRI